LFVSNKLNPGGPVTLKKPPNNKLFDPKSTSRMSPVLQRRKEQMEAAAAPPTPVAGPPVFNIALGADFANILRPAPVAAPEPLIQPTLMLLHPSRSLGADMCLSDFCNLYDLDDSIRTKFEQHGYKRSRHLRHVQLSDLTEMALKLGEVAALKDAVGIWSDAA
jgi:hypothetical protein